MSAHAQPRRAAPPKPRQKQGARNKPALAMDEHDVDPAAFIGFLPPARADAGSASGPRRRTRKTDAWRGSALTREKFVNASFRFLLKPTEVLSYGAHFADPDIALHWPNVLQILVPTFSSYSIAQGYVASAADAADDSAISGEEAAVRRQRIEEERQGRSCPICLSKPVAGRMTKCGHVRQD